jgi:hypothetical protein
MKMLKLIPQTKLKEPSLIQYLDPEYIEKTLHYLSSNLEKLEEKMSDLNEKLERHIRSYDDIAHKI